MTDPCGRPPMPTALLSMAEDVALAMGRFHPGRPAFSALSRAHDALKAAAREVDHARRAYAPANEPVGDGALSDADQR